MLSFTSSRNPSLSLQELNAKLSDYGLAKQLGSGKDGYLVTQKVMGTVGYLDPAYYRTGKTFWGRWSHAGCVQAPKLHIVVGNALAITARARCNKPSVLSLGSSSRRSCPSIFPMGASTTPCPYLSLHLLFRSLRARTVAYG